MADSSGAPQRPPSLREVLDAGGDLAPVGGWLERLAELVYIDLPMTPPSKRGPWAADARTKALDLACRRRGRRRRRRERQERALYWALVVTGQEGFSDLEDITYCRHCVSTLIETVGC